MRCGSGSLCQMLRQSIRRGVTLRGVVLPQRKKHRTSTEREMPIQKTSPENHHFFWTFACRFKFMKFIYWRVSKWLVNPLLDNFFGSLSKQALLVGCWRSSISTWEAYEETCWFQEAPCQRQPGGSYLSSLKNLLVYGDSQLMDHDAPQNIQG